jgi:hypothetical protein
MDTLKKMWDNPISKKVLIIIGCFLLFVIIIILISSCEANKRYTATEFEQKIVTVSKSYYNNHKKDLPQKDGDYVTISLQTLVNKGLIKSLDKMLEDGVTCKGNIKIINNNNYYLYLPNLDCGKNYQTKSLYDKLTSSKNVVTESNGLYKVNNEYIYKGDNVKNYLQIGQSLFRILNINDDGTIRVYDTARKDNTSWDDRYNVQKDSYFGINDYVTNGINSRIKDALEYSYKNDKEFTNDLKAFFITKSICIGKRSINDNLTDKNIECANQIDKQIFSTFLVSDYFNATLDTNCTTFDSSSCQNYNYLTDISSSWTITADKDTSYQAYRLSQTGIELKNASSYSSYRIVVNLNKDIIYESGNGSEAKPYIIKTFTEK